MGGERVGDFGKKRDSVIPGQQLTQQHSTSFSIAALYLPLNFRLHTYAIYGFCRVVDDIIDTPNSPQKKEAKLEEIRELLNAGWNNQTCLDPIVETFVQTCQENNIPQHYGFDLVNGLEKDIKKTQYGTEAELLNYCAIAGGIPGKLIGRLSHANKNDLDAAQKLGIAMQLTNILRDVKDDLKIGRVYLPQKEMERFGYTLEELEQQTVNGVFRNVVAFNIERARRYYTEARPAIERLPNNIRLGFALSQSFYAEILSEIEKMNYDVFSKRAVVSHTRKCEIIAEEKQKMVGA